MLSTFLKSLSTWFLEASLLQNLAVPIWSGPAGQHTQGSSHLLFSSTECTDMHQCAWLCEDTGNLNSGPHVYQLDNVPRFSPPPFFL